MCGISGIIDLKNRPVSEDSIRHINDLIAHRGPDGEGFYFGNTFAIAHRRLSILDLSEAGHQPMSYLEDKYTITYNGEIYNYIEIRNELIKEGYTFQSDSDTEVILATYDKYGSSCVKHFNGMWSFAIYDKIKNVLFCSRDRFGIKPFYYTVCEDQFVFGSEIKQLIPFQKTVQYNHQVLLDYLIGGFEECTNDTFFKHIFKLEQGHNMVYDLATHKFEILPFYEINIDEKLAQYNEEDAVALYGQKLEDSVRLRMRSDVEVGVCLSGGLDSSSVASIAAAHLKKDKNGVINAIHAKSTEKATDESNFAKIVAEHCNAKLNEVTPSYDDFKRVLETVIKGQEEPFGSPSIIMQYFVLQEARAKNCIVMLDGQG